MQRWLFAVAALLTGAVSVSHADYVLIRVMLQGSTGDTGMPPVNIMGMPPAANLGTPPVMGGILGSFRGVMGGPMNVMGGPVNVMGGPVNVMGGPVNVMGMPPVNNQGGMGTGLPPGSYVTAVVDIKPKVRQVVIKGAGPVLYVDHKWGSTVHFEAKGEIEWMGIPSSKIAAPLQQYAKERAAVGASRNPDRFISLAEFCLSIGLPDKAIEALNEAEKIVAESKGKMDVPKRVAKVVEAYQKIKPILAEEVPKQDKARAWKTKIAYASVAISKHYAMVHNSDDAERDGVQRRLEALESNFRTFYLLFALKGKALPAPSEKLVGILVEKPETFRKQHQMFAADELLVTDGFHARRENLAIYSPTRTDNASRNFGEMMRGVYRTNSSEELLKGKFPDWGAKITKEEAQRKGEEIARAQVMALVERALREEAEIASATHEGTGQLLAETGVLPRNTDAPEWLRFGLTSLFAMPKGPFPAKTPQWVQQSFYPGAGGPNWAWRRFLDDMVMDGSIASPPTPQFVATFFDDYFALAQELAKGPKEGVTIDAATALARARCLSWSLTYYLFTDKFDEFDKFLTDLANLPRDVELDRNAVLLSFAKAVGVDAASPFPNQPPKLEAFTPFARDWLSGVRRVPSPTVRLKLEDPDLAPKEPKDPTMPPKGPGM